MKLPVAYWITSAVVTFLGISVMTAGGMYRQTAQEGISKTVEESGITSIRASLTRSAVQIVASEHAELVTVELQNVPSTVNVSAEDGVLCVKDASWTSLHFFSFGSMNDQAGEVIITVPPETYQEIILDSGFGDENIVSGIHAENLKIDSGAGNWFLADSEIGSLKIDCGAGNTDIQNCTIGSLAYSQGAGNLTGSGVTVQEKADIESGAGNCILDVWEFGGYTDFNCGMGNLELNDIRLLADMDISSGAGNVWLSIIGRAADYDVDTDVVGKVNISENAAMPSTGETHRITIDGVGNVNISFYE